MRLTADVALVGGGSVTGFGLSTDFDSHVYLLDGGDEVALIDTGMGTPAGMRAVFDNAATDGVDGDRIGHLLLTHYHTDHAGGAGRYRERLGARTAIGAPAAEALAAGDGQATQFDAAKSSGMFPNDYEFAACPIDSSLADEETFAIGHLTVRYLSTPGHCAGHGCYLVTGGVRTYLFSGDALFAGGRLLLQAIPDCDLAASIASVRKLAGLNFDALLPGHGAIALSEGPIHAYQALAAVDRLALPANLV